MVRSLRLAAHAAGFAAAVLAALVAPARAEYPAKPIRVIVPFSAGGAVDIVTRLVTQRITAERGWSFVIENKAAAGGILATDAVAKSPPDGHTLLIATPNHTINAALKGRQLPYDWERDVVPVSVIAEVPELLVAHPAAPFTDFAGFVAYAAKNPGRLSYSSAGNGTLPHLTMELLLRRAGAKVLHVPYRGAAPALTDLLAGVVQLKLDTYATSNAHVAAGRLKALAFASARRSPLMPDLPTVAELGFPGYEGVLWIGLMAPAGTPAAIVDAVATASVAAVRSEALAERFARDGIEPVGSTPQDFAARIAREVVQWRDLTTAGNITID